MTMMVAGAILIVFIVLAFLVAAIYIFTGNWTGNANRDLALDEEDYDMFYDDPWENETNDTLDELIGLELGMTLLDEYSSISDDYSYDDDYCD